jgi:CRISPR-associated protein Csm5
MEKPLKISLLIISPVHVGCDDVYEPTGFVIDEKRKKLIAFDSLEFIKSLSDNESKEFTDLCIQGDITSIPKLYNFISSKKIAGKEIDIANGLTDNYRKVKAMVKSKDEKKIGQELNQFAISRTVYNPHNNLPYIPGSSLKGALRNAYLNKLVSDQGISKCWNKYLQEKDRANDHIIYNAIGKKAVARRFENDLLDGNFATDPFRLVKVSDFLPTGVVNTKIM